MTQTFSPAVPPRDTQTLNGLFAPPDNAWQRLSPQYRTLKRWGVVIWYAILIILVVTPLAFLTPWWVATIAGVLLLALASWRWWRQDAIWRSWGYAEREDDLFITHGLWFRSLTAVPYGRMQVVNVHSGPIQRALGLATIELVTASASTNASIPGLPAAEATRLRDHLTEVGEAKASGL